MDLFPDLVESIRLKKGVPVIGEVILAQSPSQQQVVVEAPCFSFLFLTHQRADDDPHADQNQNQRPKIDNESKGKPSHIHLSEQEGSAEKS